MGGEEIQELPLAGRAFLAAVVITMSGALGAFLAAVDSITAAVVAASFPVALVVPALMLPRRFGGKLVSASTRGVVWAVAAFAALTIAGLAVALLVALLRTVAN